MCSYFLENTLLYLIYISIKWPERYSVSESLYLQIQEFQFFLSRSILDPFFLIKVIFSFLAVFVSFLRKNALYD